MKKIALVVTTSVLAIVVILTAFPVIRDEASWKWISRGDYESYIRNWPKGKHIEEARIRLEDSIWAQSTAAGTPEAYKEYLNRYPIGRFATEARWRLDDATWNAAKNSSTPEALEAYMREFPNGKHIKNAAQLIFAPSSNLCESAFSGAGSGIDDSPAPPFLVSFKEIEDYWKLRTGPWKSRSGFIPHLEPRAAKDLQSIVCIQESAVTVGAYTDNTSAYQRRFEARLVRWPDGRVFRTRKTFEGPPPPKTKSSSAPGYGKPPYEDLRSWIAELSHDKSVIVNKSKGDDTVGVNQVAFSPDGQTLALGNSDKTVKLWNIAKGKEECSLSGHKYPVAGVAFSSDGRKLFSTGYDEIRTWDIASCKESSASPRSIAKSTAIENGTYLMGDGRTLAARSDSRNLRIFELSPEKTSSVLIEQQKDVRGVAFSPDGTRMASGSDDKTLKIWEAAGGKLLFSLPGHLETPYILAFSKDGRMLASGGSDGIVKLWDVTNGKETRSIPGVSHVGYGIGLAVLALSPDGKTLASASGEGIVKLWETATGKEICTLLGHIKNVRCLAFSPDGRKLASGSADGTVKLWDVIKKEH